MYIISLSKNTARKIQWKNDCQIAYVNLLSCGVVEEPGTMGVVGVVGGEVRRGDDILRAVKHATTGTDGVTQSPVGVLKKMVS